VLLLHVTQAACFKCSKYNIKLDMPILLKMAYNFDLIFSETSTTAGLGQLAGSETVDCASCIWPSSGFWESDTNIHRKVQLFTIWTTIKQKERIYY